MQREIRGLALVVAAATTATFASAQAAPAAVPAGWSAQTEKADQKVADGAFVTMGPGMHVTSTTNATYWNPANSATGDFTFGASFGQRQAPAEPAGYGLVWGAAKLGTSDASYLFFLVRGDGKYTVRHRANATEVHTITDWTASPALNVQDDTKGGSASNAIEVRVAADSVRLFANGKPLTAYSVKVMSGNSGVFGMHVDRGLSVHIGNFGKR